MKWNELKPGDKIFLMVPLAQRNSELVLYQPEISELIQSKEKHIAYYNQCVWIIKFKYSDIGGKRRPITLEIPQSEMNRSTLCCSSHKVLTRKMTYGQIICSNDTLSITRAYNEMLNSKTKEMEQHIEEEYRELTKLSSTYISSEIFNTL